MKVGKKFSVILLLIMMTVIIGGCSGAKTTKDKDGDSTPTVNIIGPAKGTPEETEAWETIMTKFEEETGIKVEARWQGGWADTPQNLSAARMANESVDLVIAGAGTIRTNLARSGSVMEISELMKDLENRFTDGMLDAFKFGGGLWGFPYADASASVFYYNKTMFDELGIKPPTSYDEFLEISKLIKEEKNIAPVIFQGKEGWAWPMLFFETYEQFSENSSVSNVEDFLSNTREFTTEQEKDALLAVKKLFDDEVFSADSVDTDNEGMRAVFAQQKAAMFYGGTWEYGPAKNTVKDFEIGVFEFPVMVNIPGVTPGHGYGVGDFGLAIPSFANQDNLENTMRFVEYLLRPENADIIFDAAGGATFEVIKNMKIEDSEISKVLNDSVIKNSVLFLDWIWPAEINATVCEIIPAIVMDNMTVDEGVSKIESTLSTIKEEKDYTFDWWSKWSDEDWAKVRPTNIPDMSQYMK